MRAPLQRLGCLVIFGTVLVSALPAESHGDHETFSRALLDPLVTHHAVLEDELKLNAFEYQGRRTGAAPHQERSGSLELAYAFSDAFGVEAFLPVRGLSLVSGGPVGVGDLEIDPIKYSFWRSPSLVMTTTVAALLPTGDVSLGLGGGSVVIAPHLLIDSAFGDWAWHTNIALEAAATGAPEGEIELNTALARSFFLGEHVLSPLLELSVDQGVWGDVAGATAIALTPGLKWAHRGWHLGVGAQLPLTMERDADLTLLAQVGYHLSWQGLLGDAPPD